MMIPVRLQIVGNKNSWAEPNKSCPQGLGLNGPLGPLKPSNDNIAEETGTSALRSPATRASGLCGAAGAAAAPPAAQAPEHGGGG